MQVLCTHFAASGRTAAQRRFAEKEKRSARTDRTLLPYLIARRYRHYIS